MNHTSTFVFNSIAADATHHREVLLAEASHRRLVRIARTARRAAARMQPELQPREADPFGTRVTRQAA